MTQKVAFSSMAHLAQAKRSFYDGWEEGCPMEG